MRLLIFVLFCIAHPLTGRAGEVVPDLRLLWAPGTGTLTLRFEPGCFAHAEEVIGDTMTASAEGAVIAIGGTFRVELAQSLAPIAADHCPHTDLALPAAPGIFHLRYRGRPLRAVDLGTNPLEIVLPLSPWLTLADMRELSKVGHNRILSPVTRQMSPFHLEEAGPARIADMPGSLLTHVIPDPLLYWTPWSNEVEFLFQFGCLAPNHLYLGADPTVTLDRAARTFTVSGNLRFLPLPPGTGGDGCQGAPDLSVRFRDVPAGEYRVIQDGEVIFALRFDRLDFNQDRFRIRYLE